MKWRNCEPLLRRRNAAVWLLGTGQMRRGPKRCDAFGWLKIKCPRCGGDWVLRFLDRVQRMAGGNGANGALGGRQTPGKACPPPVIPARPPRRFDGSVVFARHFGRCPGAGHPSMERI